MFAGGWEEREAVCRPGHEVDSQKVTVRLKLDSRGPSRRSPGPPGPIQFSSVARSCPTLCNPMGCSTPGLPVHHQFPEFTQTRVYHVSDAIQPSHPPSSPSPPAFSLAQHQGLFQWVNSFAWGGQSIGVSARASVLPVNTQDLISFRMDWLDLLAIQGTLKSLLQYHSSKASIFWHSAFFIVQLSHPYMTSGKSIALTRWTFRPTQKSIHECLHYL